MWEWMWDVGCGMWDVDVDVGCDVMDVAQRIVQLHRADHHGAMLRRIISRQQRVPSAPLTQIQFGLSHLVGGCSLYQLDIGKIILVYTTLQPATVLGLWLDGIDPAAVSHQARRQQSEIPMIGPHIDESHAGPQKCA